MIGFSDRTLVLGYTRSGKSELLNHHFSAIRCQRVLVDTKAEWTIPGVEPIDDVANANWSQPIVHVVADPSDLEHINRLFRAAFTRPGALVVCVHELADLCEYQPNRTPPWVSRYFSQGGAHGKGLLGASQRPVEMPRRGRSEAQHVFAVVPRMDQEDVATIAKIIGAEALRSDERTPTAELANTLDELHARAGDYAFLWFDRRERRLERFEPLPDSIRGRTIVRRRPGVS